MLIAITGKMGSGKSYYAVNLIDKLLKEDKYIITNIEGLKFEDQNLVKLSYEETLEIIKEYGYQKEFSIKIKEERKKTVVYIIDEADKLGFDKITVTERKWLSMSRHIGQDIYLITQSIELLAKEIKQIVDVEIRAKKGVFVNQFVYQWMVGKETVKWERLTKQTRLYDSYKSFIIIKKEKVNNKYLYYLVALIVVLLFMIYNFRDSLAGAFKRDEMVVRKIDKQKKVGEKNENKINEYTYIKLKDGSIIIQKNNEYYSYMEKRKIPYFKYKKNDYLIMNNEIIEVIDHEKINNEGLSTK